jgi:hypothetical protein
MSAIDPAAPRRSWLARLWAFVIELSDVLRRPSSVFGLGVLVLAGFVAGVVFWGGFNTALELTNTEKFCTGCHEMRDNVFAELKSTIHFSNRSGVRASCPNCHVPHNWTDKIARKMQAFSASCSMARRPASTATRASPTTCRTCAVFRAGNSHTLGIGGLRRTHEWLACRLESPHAALLCPSPGIPCLLSRRIRIPR